MNRWVPLETLHKNSIKEYAEVVVNQCKASVDGCSFEVFQTLYPSKTDKKIVFKKFYDEVDRNRKIARSWLAKLYYVTSVTGNDVGKRNLDKFATALKKLLNLH